MTRTGIAHPERSRFSFLGRPSLLAKTTYKFFAGSDLIAVFIGYETRVWCGSSRVPGANNAVGDGRLVTGLGGLLHSRCACLRALYIVIVIYSVE